VPSGSDREMLGYVDEPVFVRDAYRSEITLMCPVSDVEVTTVNPTWTHTSVPPFFEFDCAACGEHHVIHLGRSKPRDEQ
jgi:hypothetical protein